MSSGTAPSSASPDPYQVLQLPRNFTLEQLKSNYKRLALQLHPDKNLVSTEDAAEIFKILTASYKALTHDLQMRESDRQFDELRKGAQTSAPHTQSQETYKVRKDAMDAQFNTGRNGHFDASKFNQFFSEHRITDPVMDTGYGDWLKNDAPVDRPVPSARKALPKECKTLMLHVDAMSLGKQRLGYSEMGVEAVDDFSVIQGCRKSVGATDLRVAYSAKASDEDEDGPTAGPARKEYRTIRELELDRAKVTYSMNDREQHAFEKFQDWKDKRDNERQSTLKRYDERVERNFERVQNLLMR